mgnify:CR=1 FL=1
MSVPPLGICMYVDGANIKAGLLRYDNDDATCRYVLHSEFLLSLDQ